MWTWTCIDADTKLIPSWLVGDRSTEDCYDFLRDLRSRIRVGNRIQLTTDGFGSYQPVVWGLRGNKIDYAIVVKEYKGADGRGSSPILARFVLVDPEAQDQRQARRGLVSTSYVERQNLTMRMSVRRFTRLTDAHNKRIEQHAAAVALHFMYYNFVRPHETLGKRVTPAMAAEIETHPGP